MLPFRYLAVVAFVALASAQDYEFQSNTRPAPARIQPGFSGPAQAKPTPVAILKQINRHNEDGSYTYGYEGADGSFKIETKLPTGDVKGKYGYVDDTGKVRVVEYGATKYGFEPAGEGITVAPPTLVDETTDKNGLTREDFSQYEQPQQVQQQRAPAPRPRPSFDSFAPAPQYAPAPQPQFVPQRNPVPSRAQISGAQPVSASFDYQPRPAPQRPVQPNFSFGPAPIQEDSYEEPAQRPQPKITYAQPRPQPQPQQQFGFSSPAATQAIPRPQPPPQQQQYAPRPAPSGRPAGGVLDQLAKDYALPQGGAAPLHDISFGYY